MKPIKLIYENTDTIINYTFHHKQTLKLREESIKCPSIIQHNIIQYLYNFTFDPVINIYHFSMFSIIIDTINVKYITNIASYPPLLVVYILILKIWVAIEQQLSDMQ